MNLIGQLLKEKAVKVLWIWSSAGAQAKNEIAQ